MYRKVIGKQNKINMGEPKEIQLKAKSMNQNNGKGRP